MPHGVLRHWDPMIGVDFHFPVPFFPAFAPHLTFHIMLGLGITANYSKDVITQNAMTMLEGTDIGPMIPHIPLMTPSPTLDFDILFSSSKSYFAIQTYKVNNKPIVATIAPVFDINLNCGLPYPLPTGLVFSILNTQRVNMRWFDIFSGIAAMISDFLVQFLFQLLGEKVGTFISKHVRPSIHINMLLKHDELPSKFPQAIKVMDDVIANNAKKLANNFGSSGEVVFGSTFGGPMGIDIGNLGAVTPGGWIGDKSQKGFKSGGGWIGEYLDNSSINDH